MTEEEYIKQATEFSLGETRFSLQPFPCLDDNSGHGFDQHYIYHVAWALKKIKEINPKSHTDISSSLHLATCASAFYPTTYLDYRKPDLQLENLTVGEIDLAAQSIEPVECLSCCHVVEHIGLGRYGDRIDNTGDLKAIENLKASAANHLLFVVPVGIPTVMFNAHRVYSPVYIRNLFPEFDCEFYLIPNTRDYPYIAEIVELDIPYGCGCFYFSKKLPIRNKINERTKVNHEFNSSQLKELTDEEILKMAADMFHYSEYRLVIEFARAILTKAQEKYV